MQSMKRWLLAALLFLPSVTLLATGQTFAEVESERLENTDASLAR